MGDTVVASDSLQWSAGGLHPRVELCDMISPGTNPPSDATCWKWRTGENQLRKNSGLSLRWNLGLQRAMFLDSIHLFKYQLQTEQIMVLI
jgi:hypothetical protein